MGTRQIKPPPEAFEQRHLAAWLDSRQANGRPILWAHPPNGGHRNKVVAAKLKREGTKAGLPDVLIFTPPPKQKQTARGVAIELKRRNAKASDTTAEQRLWLEALASCGWVAFIAHGADDAINQLTELGY